MEKKPEKCSYGEDGVCAAHGVFEERRKGMEVLTSSIPRILTWQNRIIGWSILVTLFIGGSYKYTNDVKNEMKEQYSKSIESTVAEIKIMSKQFEQLSNGQARTEERYEALLRSITDMNASINTLTYLQFKDKDGKKPQQGR